MLFIRFLLRLFGANPETGAVEFIYNSTSPLLDPFRNIFTPYTIEPGNVMEISTLVAILGYILIGWLLMVFVEYISANFAKNGGK